MRFVCRLRLFEQIQRLLALPFDCVLTPNFTYEVECAMIPDFLRCPQRYLRHTAAVQTAAAQSKAVNGTVRIKRQHPLRLFA